MPTAIHRLRLARGQSLRQLAADVGCSYQTIHRLERGQTVAAWPSTRKRLEDVLGLPFEALIAPENDNGDAPEDVAAKTDNLPTAKWKVS